MHDTNGVRTSCDFDVKLSARQRSKRHVQRPRRVALGPGNSFDQDRTTAAQVKTLTGESGVWKEVKSGVVKGLTRAGAGDCDDFGDKHVQRILTAKAFDDGSHLTWRIRAGASRGERREEGEEGQHLQDCHWHGADHIASVCAHDRRRGAELQLATPIYCRIRSRISRSRTEHIRDADVGAPSRQSGFRGGNVGRGRPRKVPSNTWWVSLRV